MPNGRPAASPGEKSRTSPTSAKLAIAAYCYHNCHNEQERNSHTTKLAIRDCPSTDCFLWQHRGWQGVTGGNVAKRHDPNP